MCMLLFCYIFVEILQNYKLRNIRRPQLAKGVRIVNTFLYLPSVLFLDAGQKCIHMYVHTLWRQRIHLSVF